MNNCILTILHTLLKHMQHKLEGKQKSGVVPRCSLANEGEVGCWLSTLNPFHWDVHLAAHTLQGVRSRCQLLFFLISAFPAFLKDVNPNNHALLTPVKISISYRKRLKVMQCNIRTLSRIFGFWLSFVLLLF